MINPTTRSVTVGTTVTKVLQPGATGEWGPCDGPDDWNWWRRELVVSQHLALPDGPLRRPALLAYEVAPDHVVLELERIDGHAADLVVAAQHLGEAQAQLVPDAGWLAPDWSAGYSRARGAEPAGPVPDLPLTICHGDVWPSNLLQDSDKTWLIDWGWAHAGPLGEDLATLWVESVLFGFEPGLRAEDLITAYAAGAQEARATVRLGFEHGLATKYAWLPTALQHRDDPRWVGRERLVA